MTTDKNESQLIEDDSLSMFMYGLKAKETKRRIIVSSEVEEVVRRSLDQSQKLKQSILNMAFSGKLVRQHRDDNNILDLIQKFRAQ